MTSIRFVTGRPALTVGSSLVISDLHLGLEYDYRKGGISLPSQTGKLMKAVDSLITDTRPERLIIIGDVKHKVPGTSFQEVKEIPEFFSHLSGSVKVEIVPGNHDAGIEKMLPSGIRVHPGTGFIEDDLYFGHGHTWPAEKALTCSHMILGHRHPLIEFRDRLGYRFLERVWVKGELDPEKLRKRYKDVPEKLPEIVLLPAFNPILGGTAVNRKIPHSVKEKIGPLINSMKGDSSRLYMLDGTYLGTVSAMKAKVN
jgi:putative SbcD/Mre11-related phosphoesterase